MLKFEVGNTNGLSLASLLQLDELLPCLDIGVIFWARPVDKVEIHVVEAELVQRLVEGRSGISLAVIPQLRGDEELLARDAGRGNRTAHAFLVAVDSCGVDVAVAHLEGFEDQLFGLLRVNLEDAEAELGDSVAIVECDIGYSHAAHSTQRIVIRAEKEK